MLDEALKIRPGEPESTALLAKMEVDEGHPDRAKALYLNALKFNPGNSPPWSHSLCWRRNTRI